MRRAVFFVALLAVGLLGQGTPVFAADRAESKRNPVAYAIGDSVLLGARQDLRDLGIVVDAVEGRQPRRLRGAVIGLPNDGRPVVVHLGTNGLFDRETCRDLRESVDGERDVVLVTVRAPRPWVSGSNEVIRSCVKKFEESRAVIVPWHRIAAVHSHLVYSDGIHLRPEGADVFVDLIRQRLGLCQEPKRHAGGDSRAQVGLVCGPVVTSG